MRSCAHPFDEPVRPGADRPLRHPVAELARGLGRDHHAGAVGKLRHQRRIGLGKLEPHRHRVDHHGGLDRLELGHAARIGRRLVALDVELHRLGIERLAVVEQDAGAQLHGEREAVGRPRPFGRKLRHIGELRVELDQLVAHRRHHDAIDEAHALRRIERRGIGLQPDAQRLRRCGGRENESGADDGRAQHGGLHDERRRSIALPQRARNRPCRRRRLPDRSRALPGQGADTARGLAGASHGCHLI